MMSTKHAVASLVVAAVVTTAGTAAWFVATHRHSDPISASGADAEFDRIRARFSHEQPFVDMADRQLVGGAPTSRVSQPPRTFHTVIFDRRGGDRLVRMTVPFWFARRYARHDGEFHWLGEFSFLDDTEFDPEPIRVSLNDLERRGAGLVVDYRHPGGGQFLAWIE
jgi:hypothetical protein